MIELIAKACECMVMFLAALGLVSLVAAIILIIIWEVKEARK